MNNWKTFKLEDLSSDFAMGPFGSNIKAENFVSSGVPVIKGKNLNYYKYVDGDFDYLTPEKANELIKSNCYPDDLVFTHRGTIGQVGLIPTGKYERYVVSQSGMKVTVNTKLINPEFLLYFFKSDIGQHELLQNESQVGVPSISSPLTSLKAVQISLPSLDEQKAIAEVLSSLDDKIDLLRRQNKTLEALAETLFYHTFIDNSQDDWPIEKIKDVADVAIGRTPPRKEKQWFSKKPENVKWVSIKDMASEGVYMFKTSEYLTAEAVEKFRVPVIPDNTVLLSFKMTVGRVSITSSEMLSNEAIAHFKLFDLNKVSTEFLYLFLKQFRYETLGSTSSIVTSINSGMIKDLPLAVPDEETHCNFISAVSPYFKKIKKNQIQIQTLENLRDTLLPKLMSGEVRVQYDKAA